MSCQDEAAGPASKGQTIFSPNVRLGKGKHGLVEGGKRETEAQVKDVPAFIMQLFSPKTFLDYKQCIRCNNRPSWNMRKTNGHLLYSINLLLKMLCFSLFCIFFFFVFVEEIGFCPLAQQQHQIVCCSQVDLISASAHTAAPLPVEISFSLLLTQEKRCGHAHTQRPTHTQNGNMIFSSLTNVYLFAHTGFTCKVNFHAGIGVHGCHTHTHTHKHMLLTSTPM